MTTKSEDAPKALAFNTDRGASRSKWVAAAMTLGIVGWMGSGYVIPSEEATATERTPVEVSLVSVAVEQSKAETVPRVFTAEGQALPDRDTLVRSELSGELGELLVSKGDMLEANQLIARFDTDAAQANLTRAEESLAQSQREYDNALELQARGIATTDRVTAARTSLASAEANVISAQDALDNGEVRAPFAGRLEALDVNEGEFVTAGSQIARIVDNTPLTVRIQIPQQARKQIQVGQTAEIQLITGENVDGVVAFIGSSADSATRTFEAEIVIENEDGLIPAGVSAQVKILTGELSAHFISPAILSLNTEGVLGVKTVSADNYVVFQPIEIVQAQTDGIWVSGLDDEIDMISIGQGFVNNGELVNPMAASALAAQTAQAELEVTQ